MATPLPSSRHNNALKVATSYRRVVTLEFQRALRSTTLEPTSLSLTQDKRRNMRWNGSVSFVDSDVQPTRPSDLLTPFGTTCTVWVGIELSDGTQSMVPYGVYSISAANTETSATSRTTNVTLIDLADGVDRYRFEAPVTVGSGTDLAEMVNSIIFSRTGTNPGLDPVGRSLSSNRTFGLDPETGPWAELIDVLDGFGYSLWYGRNGQLNIAEIGDSENAYPLVGPSSISVDFDSRPANVVVVRSEPPESAPQQAVAWDDDPGSPTFAGTDLEDPPSTPYGRVTKFYSTPLELTGTQAADAAMGILRNSLGAGSTQDMTRAFDPTTDVGDLVSFEGQEYAIDAITLDISGSTTHVVRRV